MRAPLLLLALAGCATSYVHPPGPCGPACADIVAARQLSTAAERNAAFGKFAQRADLTPHEQMFLVDSVLENGLDKGEADVLIALILNPLFYPESRFHLSFRLEDFSSSPQKKRVIDAMVEHPGRGRK